jgi:hypothetical protein
VLLATFIVIEARSEYALMPLRIFRNRDRSADGHLDERAALGGRAT